MERIQAWEQEHTTPAAGGPEPPETAHGDAEWQPGWALWWQEFWAGNGLHDEPVDPPLVRSATPPTDA